MSETFKGVINVDIRDSVPDWSPFEPPRAPDGAPSVIYIVLDDVGFSAMSSYGGPIPTPNIDRIAADGVRYTQWHTTALCSPTRSCLLTGRNHTRNSMACITEAAIGFPNASGTIPPENGTLSEILGELGWNTYMVGKWHLCPDDEMNLASTRRNWPSGRGFERWYGFLGAETNQWYPDLVYDNHLVDQPKSPEEGYHLTVDITDKALEFIRDSKAIAPEKPFFLYYAPGACHAPHHAPKEWIDKFKGQFDMGYEAMREETLARQKELGIVPKDTELPPVNPIGTPETRTGPDGKPFPMLDVTRPWDSLSDDEKKLFCRMAEVYAGFLAHADDQIGRLLDFLEEFGWRENTLVMLVSDNGASGEGGPNGSVNEMKFVQRRPRQRRGQPAADRRARQPDHVQPLPERLGDGVQHAVQDVEALRVQRRHERPVHRLVARRDEVEGRDPPPVPPRDRPRADGARRARRRGARGDQGHTSRRPFDGVSMRSSFDHPRVPSTRTTQFYAMLGSRAIWHDGWKAVTNHPTSPAGATSTTTSGSSTTPRSTAPSCTTSPPSTRRRSGSSRTSGSRRRAPTAPSRSTTARRWRSSLTPRPVLSPRRGTATCTSRTRRRSPSRRRSTSATARSGSARSSTSPPRARRACSSRTGSLFGGHALYVKDNRLHYVYNFVGITEEQRRGDARTSPRREADPGGVVRQGRRGARRASPTARSRSATATTKVGEGQASRPSPASS